MRSIHLGLFALFTSAVLMVSCAEDELIENNHHLTSSETINFDAIVEWPEDYMDSRSATSSLKRVESPKLRAEEGNETLPMGVYVQDGIYPTSMPNPESRGAVITQDKLESFNVWATLNKAENVGGEAIEYFSDVEYTKGDNDVFSSSGKVYYWPGEGPTIDFVAVGNANDAFSPTMTGASGTFTYTVPTAATAQNDIVVAKAASIPGNNNESVPLDFQHIMSAVNVKVGSEITAGTINSITFKNIYSTGTYDVASNAWGSVGELKDYTITFANGSSNYATEGKTEGTLINGDNATLMMIPQTLANISDTEKVEIIVNFSYAASGQTKDLTASLDGQAWAMGKTTNYYINVSPDFTLSIEEESVPIADCHYDIREITISDESNVGWTLSSNADWVKFRVMPADYSTNANYTAYKDYYIETHTVTKVDITLDQTKEDNEDTAEDERITTTTTTTQYTITNTLKGTGDAKILVYCDENTGSSNDGIRSATVSLKDSKGNEHDVITVGQYYPLWGAGSIAYERIEEDKNTYPWGFASSRTVTYTYPAVNVAPSWATATTLGRIIWWIIEQFGLDDWFYQSRKETRGTVYANFYENYAETATTGFITISPTGGDGTAEWGENNAWSVKLDYSKLNDINTNDSGLENTKKILTYGGGTTGSDAETFLINNSLTKGTETNNTDNTTIPETAAYQAVKKNRWNINTNITTTTTITNQGTQEDAPVITNELVLASDDIQWFLPSNGEIVTLQPTACDADNTNNDDALSGTYWTSTSADNIQAYSYTEAISQTAARTTKYKIRAARVKP